MDINKEEMKQAFLNCDSDPKSLVDLVNYCYDIANYFVSRFNISQSIREDYVQFSVNRAIRKMDLFKNGHINKDGKASEVFSYFYKMIRTNVHYCMRREQDRLAKIPNGSCSIDVVGDISDKVRDFTEDVVDNIYREENGLPMLGERGYDAFKEDEHLMIDGKVYNKNQVFAAVKQAKKMLRSFKNDKNFKPDTSNSQVYDFYQRLKEEYFNEIKSQELKDIDAKNKAEAELLERDAAEQMAAWKQLA